MTRNKIDIFKNTAYVLVKLIIVLLCFFIFLFPVFNFQINLTNVIFPATEIIFLYYFISIKNINLWIIFLSGIFIDILYGMPIGINSLAFLLTYLSLRLANRFFLIKNYLTNFFIFCFCCFCILNCRFLLIKIKGLQTDSYTTLLFQYLTTILTYNLMRPLFDYFLGSITKPKLS